MKELTLAAFAAIPSGGLNESDFAALPDPPAIVQPVEAPVVYGSYTISGTCTGPNCYTPTSTLPQRSGWYPGKNLRR